MEQYVREAVLLCTVDPRTYSSQIYKFCTRIFCIFQSSWRVRDLENSWNVLWSFWLILERVLVVNDIFADTCKLAVFRTRLVFERSHKAPITGTSYSSNTSHTTAVRASEFLRKDLCPWVSEV